MSYDELLATRIRALLNEAGAVVAERKMFGGLAFMFNGYMFVGIVGDELMVRLGEHGARDALKRDSVREMDFTGRPMKAMVFVQPDGLKGPALGKWVVKAMDFVDTLPPKTPK